MSATKAQIIRAIGGYHEAIIGEVERRCEDLCRELIWSAIKYRKTAFDAHDFTGNLLNSIVVCLYKEQKPLSAWYAEDVNMPKPIRAEMTYRTKRKNAKRPVTVYFNPDYSGSVTAFTPLLITDESWGIDDAKNFFRSFTPKGKNLFDIVVAYTSEYAEYVEMERGTTGILNAYQSAQFDAKMLLRLPRK